jgi:hypothetical protein
MNVVNASTFLGVDGGVDFNEPVQPPTVTRTIEGVTDDILGNWQIPDCNGCLGLTIQTEPTTGHTVGYGSWSDPNGSRTITEFAPAIDPSRGYPVELDPSQYASLRENGVANRLYTLFDGNVSGGHLTGWFSYRELWSDWCALQKPTRIQVNGEARDVCTPNIHDETVDLGKRVLCTSADMDSSCPSADEPFSTTTPCVCTMGWEGGNPLCSPNYCLCDATHCEANLWSGAQWVDLTLIDGKFVGSWFLTYTDSPRHVVMARVTP